MENRMLGVFFPLLHKLTLRLFLLNISIAIEQNTQTPKSDSIYDQYFYYAPIKNMNEKQQGRLLECQSLQHRN